MMHAPAPPLDPQSCSYVLCYFQGPGVPWSEEPLGKSFFSWAERNLPSNAEEFSWLLEPDPGEQMNEFVTAQNTRPGQDPYVKPSRACEMDPGKTYQASKMAVRHIRSRARHHAKYRKHVCIPFFAYTFAAQRVQFHRGLVSQDVVEHCCSTWPC